MYVSQLERSFPELERLKHVFLVSAHILNNDVSNNKTCPILCDDSQMARKPRILHASLFQYAHHVYLMNYETRLAHREMDAQ